MVANSKCYLQKQRTLAHFAGIQSRQFHSSESRQLRTGQSEVRICFFTSELTVFLIRRKRNSESLQRIETHWLCQPCSVSPQKNLKLHMLNLWFKVLICHLGIKDWCKAIFGERKMLTETNSKIQDFDKNVLGLFLISFDAVLYCCCSLIHCTNFYVSYFS